MSKRQLFTGTFLLVFLLLLWEMGLILRPFFSPIFWALILATTTYPLYVRLLGRTGRREQAQPVTPSPASVGLADTAGDGCAVPCVLSSTNTIAVAVSRGRQAGSMAPI